MASTTNATQNGNGHGVATVELATRERFSSVAVFDSFSAVQRYEDARVIPDEQHRPSGILPKGKRTRGRRIESPDQVYVR